MQIFAVVRAHALLIATNTESKWNSDVPFYAQHCILFKLGIVRLKKSFNTNDSEIRCR